MTVAGISIFFRCYSSYSRYSWCILPIIGVLGVFFLVFFFSGLGTTVFYFWQLRLPFAEGIVPATAVAYFLGAVECLDEMYRVIRSLAVW